MKLIKKIFKKRDTISYPIPPETVGHIAEIAFEVTSIERAMASSWNNKEQLEQYRLQFRDKKIEQLAALETAGKMYANTDKHFANLKNPPTPTINFLTNTITIYLYEEGK